MLSNTTRRGAHKLNTGDGSSVMTSTEAHQPHGQNLVGLDTPPRAKGEELKERKAARRDLAARAPAGVLGGTVNETK